MSVRFLKKHGALLPEEMTGLLQAIQHRVRTSIWIILFGLIFGLDLWNPVQPVHLRCSHPNLDAAPCAET